MLQGEDVRRGEEVSLSSPQVELPVQMPAVEPRLVVQRTPLSRR